MKKKDFAQLVESIKQMKQIQAGTLKPARVTKYEELVVKEIRKKMRSVMMVKDEKIAEVAPVEDAVKPTA